MAVNVYLRAVPSREVETVKKEGGLHSRKIWRLSDAKKYNPPATFIYIGKGAQISVKGKKRESKCFDHHTIINTLI